MNKSIALRHSIIIGLWLVFSSLTTWAGTFNDEITFVQERIDYLTSLQDNPNNQQLKDVYRQTLDTLKQHQRNLNEAENNTRELETFPKQLQQLKQKLTALKRAKTPEVKGDLSALERTLTLKDVELLGLNGEKSRAQNELDDLNQGQIRVREELSSAYARQEELTPDITIVDRPQRGNLNDAINFKMLKQRDMQVARTRKLELELLNIPNRIELKQIEINAMNTQIVHIEQFIERLQQRIQMLRNQKSEQAMAESLQLSKEKLDLYPPLRWLNSQNETLRQSIAKLNSRIELILTRKPFLDKQLKEVDQTYRITKQQLELSNLTDQLGVALRKRLNDLPSNAEVTIAEKRLDATKMKVITLEQLRQELATLASDPLTLFERFDQAVPKGSADLLENALLPMLQSTIQLIGNAQELNQKYVNQLTTLISQQEQMNDKIQQLQHLLTANMPWVPSARPIDKSWLTDLKASSLWLVAPSNARQIWQAVSANALALALIGIVLFAVRVLLQRVFIPRFEQWQLNANACVGNARKDSIAYPIGLLAGDAALVLPLPISLALISRVLAATPNAGEFTLAIANGLHVLSIVVLLNGLMVRLTRPKGLIAVQFKWPGAVVDGLHRDHRDIARYLVPLIGMIGFFETPNTEMIRNGIGRLGLLVGCLIITGYAARWFGWRTVHRERVTTVYTPLWKNLKIWAGLVIANQLWVIVMAANGHYYGAIIFWVSFVQSYFFLFGVLLVYGLTTRWLLIVQRKMAFTRAKAKQVEQQTLLESRVTDDFAESIDENYVDIETVNQQTRFILKVILLAFAVTCLSWIWAEMLPTLTLLNNIKLWSAVVTTEAGEQLQTVTLQTFLYACFIISLALIAAHNLPGVLELMLLRHLPLNPGTGYAITTLLKYIIVGTGTVITLSMLGMQWSKLQWMVAALSVGLGFGLQEILANFVSGLIILFEKPIRIGDTVTINGRSGTITGIRIRSTTITDWDRMEIILPNKTFITSELINWSLSDPITRIVFPLTLPYGSDTALAKKLLLQIADENPTILKEPEPAALCLGLSEGRIKFELRAYVNGIGNRLPVTHDVNAAIERKLREHNIEMAPPQMDIRLRTETTVTPMPDSARLDCNNPKPAIDTAVGKRG